MHPQLISTTGLSAPIYTLPGREPFMLAADLAVAYGTEYRRVTEALKRNPNRFPEDFAFYLTEAETDGLKSQNVISNGKRLPQNAATSPGKRTDLRPLALTHGGAYALSSVLKTPTAADVATHVFRTFAAFEKRAFEQMRYQLIAAQTDAKKRSPLRVMVVDGTKAGLSFDAIWRMGAASRPKLAGVVHECMALGLIDQFPAGTPIPTLDLFSAMGVSHG